jgi:hypothetical protein
MVSFFDGIPVWFCSGADWKSMLSRRFGVPLAVRLSSGLFVLVQPLVSLLPGLSVLS